MKKIIFALLMIILSCDFVLSIGLSPAIKEIEHNSQDTRLAYQIINNNMEDLKVSVYAIGEIADYLIIPDKEIIISKNEQDKSFEVIINGSKSIRAGTISGKIIVEENLLGDKNSETGVFARLKIASILNIKKEYPSKYVDVKLDVKSEGKSIIINAELANLGKEDVKDIKPEFGVYSDGKKVYDIGFDKKSLNIGQIENISKKIELYNLNQGEYNAIMKINYDNYVLEIGKDFSIGEKEIKILDYTKYFLQNSLNKFEIDAESEWNNKILDVYSTIDILEKMKRVANLRSSSYDFNPGERKTISAYWDTNKVDLGEYDADMNVIFSGKNTNMTGKIKVLNPDDYRKALNQFSWLWIIIFAVIAVIVINLIFWFFILKKKKRNSFHK
jgi:hypothetical protein